ncbi:thioredoxin-dependent thiol peroxidase [bacterium]|nr:thioredoxin-dependent thiol peroxidase [bacterium]|tara:strand:+ start:1264 stop:1722 length:459 start_codon:yes stop_codon:yes gene_type:complete
MSQNGEKAPEFSLANQDNTIVNLTDYRGKKVVLYFYPKDDTSGCTKEAEEFTQKKKEFDSLNTVILGISKDSTQSHETFCKKYNLGITLLSDPDTEINKAYDVWKEKSMYGKKYFGTERTTFLIDEDGIIQQRWSKVKVTGHVEDVLKALSK